MNRRWLLGVAGAVVSLHGVFVAACAAEGGAADASADGSVPPPPPAIEAGDGGGDAACTGVDCEYFPAECTEDALCSAGLFDPSSPGGGLDPRTQITALAARSPNDVWVAGTVGHLGHFDGSSWSVSPLGGQQSVLALWLRRGSEVAFDHPDRIYTRGVDAGADAEVSSGGWSLFGRATLEGSWGYQMQIVSSWAHPDASSAWVGGVRGGTAGLWRVRYSVEAGAFTFTPMPLFVDGTWLLDEVYGLHGLSPDEVWGVGPTGKAFRITNADSDAPTLTGFNTLTMQSLEGVWVASSNDVWAVGAAGTVRRYRGDARFWEPYEELPTKQHLRAIGGSGPDDIWVAGDDATVYHFDGAAWKRVKVAGLGIRRPRLEHLWVPSRGKVWIAGQGTLVSPGGKP